MAHRWLSDLKSLCVCCLICNSANAKSNWITTCFLFARWMTYLTSGFLTRDLSLSACCVQFWLYFLSFFFLLKYFFFYFPLKVSWCAGAGRLNLFSFLLLLLPYRPHRNFFMSNTHRAIVLLFFLFLSFSKRWRSPKMTRRKKKKTNEKRNTRRFRTDGERETDAL